MPDPRRMVVRESVLSCSNCELAAGCTSPVPFSGTTPASIAIVGEAPGKSEDAEGRPFVGPAGELIRDHLGQVGINPAEMFICNTVSCFPRGSPTEVHMKACRPNKLAQLTLAGPRWVLLLGNVALQSFRPGMVVSKGRGRPFQSPDVAGAVFMATYHPEAGLRNRLYEREMHADLERFVRIMGAGESWHQFIGDDCWQCDRPWVWLDNGIPTCEKHAPDAYREHRAIAEADYQAVCERLAK